MSLARADVLVAAPGDFAGAGETVLRDSGFRGVVVLVDDRCGPGDTSSLYVQELEARIRYAGSLPMADSSGSSLRSLLSQLGTGSTEVLALKCWEDRTLYVGADRSAAAAYAGMLEVPPGAFGILAEASDDKDLSATMNALLQGQLAVGPAKTKLLAYLADTCLPEAETFFDMAGEVLQGLGVIEALGRCHGTHPNKRPVRCGNAACSARTAWKGAVAELRSFRFAMAFDASADHPIRCFKHIGAYGLFEALAAGTVPVYRGPFGTDEVLNQAAFIYLPAWLSLREGVLMLRSAATDAAAEASMVSAQAILGSSSERWFSWVNALAGLPTVLATDVLAHIARLGEGSPHLDCTATVRAKAFGVPMPCTSQACVSKSS